MSAAPYRARFTGGPVDGREFMVPSLALARFVTPGDVAAKRWERASWFPPAREPIGRRLVYVLAPRDGDQVVYVFERVTEARPVG